MIETSDIKVVPVTASEFDGSIMDEPITSEEIMSMNSAQLIDHVVDCFDLDKVERVRVLALLQVRAVELGIERQVEKLIKQYESIDKDMERDYQRQRAYERLKLHLKLDGKGEPLPTIENFLTIMKNDPRYAGVKYNLLANKPEVHCKGQILTWTDTDDASSRKYIETTYHIHNEGKHRDALRLLFREREYHPVKDIVDAVKWDGESRIESFLSRWALAEDTPYVREVSRLIFAGGIHRLYRPGCKFDDVPVLIGTSQGEGKSTLVRWLAINDAFFAEVTAFEGKESIEQLDGVWIGEVAELLALTKTKEQEAVKQYITRQRDRNRRPYSERIEEFPRRCIFVGTTNNEQFLRDKTGNRRFYPVTVHSNGYWLYSHEQECREYILQCWAEAKAKYDAGELPAVANPMLSDEYKRAQEEAVEDDWRVGAIEAFLDEKEPGELVCVREIMRKALSPNPDFPKDPSPKDSQEISLIMAKNFPDWEKVGRVRTGHYGRQRCWRKPNPDEDMDAVEWVT